MASDNLSLDRPRIGYARPLIASYSSNHSTIIDYYSVITLGHTYNVPLIRSPSDLSYGSEPHGLI